jgi:hypothetical protein
MYNKVLYGFERKELSNHSTVTTIIMRFAAFLRLGLRKRGSTRKKTSYSENHANEHFGKMKSSF